MLHVRHGGLFVLVLCDFFPAHNRNIVFVHARANLLGQVRFGLDAKISKIALQHLYSAMIRGALLRYRKRPIDLIIGETLESVMLLLEALQDIGRVDALWHFEFLRKLRYRRRLGSLLRLLLRLLLNAITDAVSTNQNIIGHHCPIWELILCLKFV